jgi:hypothetical protein
MHRAGDYEAYKGFQISKEQEDIWTTEYEEELLSKVSSEEIASDSFLELTRVLRGSKNIQHLSSLLDNLNSKRNRMDTFTKLCVAEQLLEIVGTIVENENRKEALTEARHFARDILNDSLRKPITIAPFYRKLDYLHDVLSDEKIVKRIQRSLKRIKKEMI